MSLKTEFTVCMQMVPDDKLSQEQSVVVVQQNVLLKWRRAEHQQLQNV